MGVCPVRKREGKWDTESQVRWCHRQRSKFLEGQRVHVCLAGHGGSPSLGKYQSHRPCQFWAGLWQDTGTQGTETRECSQAPWLLPRFCWWGKLFQSPPYPWPFLCSLPSAEQNPATEHGLLLDSNTDTSLSPTNFWQDAEPSFWSPVGSSIKQRYEEYTEMGRQEP